MDSNVPESYIELPCQLDFNVVNSEISDSDAEDVVASDFPDQKHTLSSKYSIPDVSGCDLDKLECVFDIRRMEFDEEDEAYLWYNCFARSKGFSVRIGPGQKSRVTNRLFRKTFYCSKQGLKKVDSSKSRLYSRKNTRCRCLAKFVILRDAVRGPWRVSIFRNNHNHEMIFPNLVEKLFSHNSFHRSLVCKSAMDELLEHLRPCVAKEVINTLFKGSCGDVTTQQVVQRLRQLRVAKGGGECAQVFRSFVHKQNSDPGFFFAYDLNKDLTLKHLFWADSRSQASYASFRDVIVFDVTYRTNSVGYPFAPFTGVNHHYQSTLFGCAFLSNEREESFIWLFEQFLRCMKYKHPSCIITDQDHAICKAVQHVFVHSRHRYCSWHFRKHVVDHMRTSLKQRYSDFEDAFFNWLNFGDIEKSEKEFEKLISSFGIPSNSWLLSVYEKRHHWLPCLLKDCFWAGMSTSQRAESINSFFDGFVNSSTPLSTFVEQYDKALTTRRKTEEDSDRITVDSCHFIHERVQLKKSAAKVLTNKILIFFEEQWELSENLKSRMQSFTDSLQVYVVGTRKEVDDDNGCKVVFDRSIDECLRCSCGLFPTKGIPCCHILHLMRILQFDEIPAFYILRRWSISSRFIHSTTSSRVDIDPPSSSHLLLSTQVLKVLDLARGDSSVSSKIEGFISHLLQSSASGKDPMCLNATDGVGVDIPVSSDPETDYVDVRDPEMAIKTKGRPRDVKRIPSRLENLKKNLVKVPKSSKGTTVLQLIPLKECNVPGSSKNSGPPKQRHCSNCGVLGHKRTKCPN